MAKRRSSGLSAIRNALTAAMILMPAAAFACPEPSAQMLFHSCWGDAQASSLLLPEEGPVPAGGVERLVITGGYTGKDARQEALPNPVGMFVHKGTVVNATVARMDGVVILAPDGALSIQHRKSVELGQSAFDLTDIGARRAFQKAALAAGLSVFQSHLVIVDGVRDTRPRDGAPVAVRRLLFTDEHGYGVYQTEGPMTLHDSAVDIHAAQAPQMAVNLDMGSFDYCLATRDGVEQNCGVLGRENTQKLSNLLVLDLKPRS